MSDAARVDAAGRLQGFTVVVLENAVLRVEVLPQLGGRVWSLVHKPTATQWLWHNPRVPLARQSFGANYDDHWVGGWDDLYPNDAAGRFLGRELPDHGEWWSQAWDWEILAAGPERAGIRLWRAGVTWPARCEKRVELARDAAVLDLGYRITNDADTAHHFLFKLHPALAVTPHHQLELPGGLVEAVDPTFGTLLGGGGPFPWPAARDRRGGELDLRTCPAPSQRHREFIYVKELPEGWCGALDTRTGARFRLTYPREVFPYVWVFATFAGWREHYTVVLEPCTNWPKDLDTAYRRRTCAILGPGEVLDCRVAASVHRV